MTDDLWTEADELTLRRATTGLSEAERDRLAELRAESPEADSEWIDRLLGELDAELVDREGESELPAELRATLQAWAAEGRAARAETRAAEAGTAAGAPTAEARAAVTPIASARSGWGTPRGASWLGWAAAAVLAGLLLIPDAQGPAGPEVIVQPPDPVERALAVAGRPDARTLAWTATEDPTAVGGVSGEVVWSDAAQSGFMRFAGLAANDPGEFQYQLWIFDAERDERYPVDGGVFDIPEGGGEVVVPIDARLPVGEATLFAVTVEPPGGVVVSDRSRIAVLAQGE